MTAVAMAVDTAEKSQGAIIHATDVSVVFNGMAAVDRASVAIRPGRITAICGANGSGKSTLLKCLSGLEAPTSGAVLLAGQALAGLSRRQIARQVAVLGQNPETPAGLNVEELVEQGRYPHRPWLTRLRGHDQDAIERAIAAVDLKDMRQRQLASLSGGERQRAWVAMALAQEPQILFLDEPTSFLDVRHQAELLTLLRRLNREEGLTIIAVLHDLNQVIEFADDVILMKKGQVLSTGAPVEIFTPRLLSHAFGCTVDVVPHPHTGRPFCLIDWVGDRSGRDRAGDHR
ncbi:putative siderophore transport system ATP-binding protein YusV [Ensifer sp. M14]|uniref:ABC transporter ATP-binding protein n=1 Tax=Ensifer sp. M14 TaxID=2203782 RepID=UPI000E2BBEE0|nr:ABC transporter ATP-binding protein [Ensifer sp. M14]RDL46944.1 putative siderophore transport system ATP-binding protein YusV [Ensifer sp. M14]